MSNEVQMRIALDQFVKAAGTALQVIELHRQRTGDHPMGMLGVRAREELEAAVRMTQTPSSWGDSDSTDCDSELDDDDPLWLVNEQIKGLLEGQGASEDHQGVINFLLTSGLPKSTVDRLHKAIVFGDSKEVKRTLPWLRRLWARKR